MIYFMACPAAGAVKIGVTGNKPFVRLVQAQVNCPLDLELMAVCEGGSAIEAALHLRFADQRIRGEWFRLTPELRDHIAQFPKPERPPRGWHGQSRNMRSSHSQTARPGDHPRTGRVGGDIFPPGLSPYFHRARP